MLFRSGRDGIYFAWNLPFAGMKGWENFHQNHPGAPKHYKPDKKGFDEKRQVGVGLNLRKMMFELEGFNLREFTSGALITSMYQVPVNDYVTCVYNWDGTPNHDYWDPTNTVSMRDIRDELVASAPSSSSSSNPTGSAAQASASNAAAARSTSGFGSLATATGSGRSESSGSGTLLD